jgi:hypothetical protein
MKLASLNRSSLLLLALFVFVSGACSGRSQVMPTTHVSKVSMCALMATPKQYSGSMVEVAVRFTRTKEGTRLWDISCPDYGADLWIDPAVANDPSFLKLDEMLNAHGLSDHPVMATIQGVFSYAQYDKVRRQKRSTIKAEVVSDIKQFGD